MGLNLIDLGDSKFEGSSSRRHGSLRHDTNPVVVRVRNVHIAQRIDGHTRRPRQIRRRGGTTITIVEADRSHRVWLLRRLHLLRKYSDTEI